MKGKMIALAFSATLVFSTSIHTVNAESYSSKIDEVRDEQAANEKVKINKESELEKVKQEQKTAEDEILRIDKTLTDTNKKIDAQQAEIDETEEKVEQLKQEIVELEKRIAERDKLLKDRVRSMYVNGGTVNYLDVLLGAKSFSDFINRVSALNMIAEQDKQILEEHKADKMALENAQTELNEELASLESKLAELNDLKAQLDQQMKEKQQALESLQAKEGEIEEYIVSIEEEQSILKAREAALIKEKQAAERRAREAAKAKAESEAAKKSATTTTANSTEGDSGNFGSEVEVPQATPSVSSSMFIRPTEGIITDRFGTRGGTHYGVDIAKSGLVPIVAAADGTVSKAYRSSSYGNVVFIVHYIDGQMYESVYAHQRYYTVSAGQQVKKGQIIGYQGNTGNSFGQHLHFELHKGGWNASKSNAVNPLNYFD